MRIFSILTPIFLTFLFAACSPSKKYAKEVAQIDSCLAVIDSIEMQLKGIDFDSLNLMVNHVLMNEDSMKKYYQPDTLSLYIGTRMSECKGIRKSLTGLNMKEQNYKTEIAAERKQFTDLKSDIEEGVLTEEKIHEYLDNEMKNLHILNESFTEFYYIQKTNKRYYYFSVPVIDSLIIQLKNEQNLE